MKAEPQPADIKAAQDVIASFQKARKSLRMYPSNNPIYVRTIEDVFRRLDNILEIGPLELGVRQNEILFGDTPVYTASGMEDNLAFFFFKDGLREISFKSGLTLEETREFLEAISQDSGMDEDIVTLLWEKDLEHIKYVIDENFLLEDETYETEAVLHAREETTPEEDLKRAHSEAFSASTPLSAPEIVPLSSADFEELMRAVRLDSADKLIKLISILFDILSDCQPAVYPEVAGIIKSALEHSIRKGDLSSALGIFSAMDAVPPEGPVSDLLKKEMKKVQAHASSLELVKALGEHLDSGQIRDEEMLIDYVRRLDSSAIASLIAVLGDLKTMEARKTVMNALAFLGNKDLNALAKGLSDPRWYVVRNIIHIFRKMEDRRCVDFVIKASRHSDVRVRIEVIRALGELGGQGVIQTVRDALGDSEFSVRSSAARALGMLKTEPARMILMQHMAGKDFMQADFNEKKEFFEVLSGWNGPESEAYMIKCLRAGSLFHKGRTDELKACAAYALGLMGAKNALPLLHKLRDSKNRTISDYAFNAIKRIEYGN
ncbi:MAG: HEAT repeat domain-containing protein [Nitrospiraceae bacterium]|nr:HEAT repeat domain-containing protein [Nitrospiraceae bacterium]